MNFREYVSEKPSGKILPVFCAALTLACGGALAAGTFVTAIPGMPATLDPAGTYDRYGFMIEAALYDPLISFSGNSPSDGFVPALSAEVPTKENGLLSGDGLTYIFPIRKGVKFHDGSPLTAEDAAYSLIRFMITDVPVGPSHLFLKPLLGISSMLGGGGKPAADFAALRRAVRADGDKLVITLKEPFPPLLSLLASRPFVTSKAWAAAAGEWDGAEATWKKFSGLPHEKSRIRALANGTGPFKLEKADLGQENGGIILVRNGDYWRAPAALDRLVFNAVERESCRLSMLEVGDIDHTELGPDQAGDIAEMKDIFAVEASPGYSISAIAFNFRIEPAMNPFIGSGALDGKGIPADLFMSADVRKGFAYALNYDKIFSEIWRSKGARITSPIPRQLAPGRPPFVFDPEKAGMYFKKALGGRLWEKGFELTLPCLTGDSRTQRANEIIAEELRKINPLFVVKLKPIKASDYSSPEKQLELLRRMPLSWRTFEPDYPDAYNYAFSMMHSGGGMNQYSGYSSPEADKFCEKALREEGAEREKALSALDRIYSEDAPYLLLFHSGAFRAFRKGITGTDSDNWLFNTNNYTDYYRLKKP